MNEAKLKAEGHNISFHPASLYGRAKTYGKSQDPKLNPSKVTCIALKEFLDREAPDDESDLSVAIAQVRAANAKDKTLAPDLLQFIRDRKRTRRRR